MIRCLSIITWVLCLNSLNTTAQDDGYKINIDGINDSVVYLGSYYGDRIISVDTAYGSKGKFVFEAKKSLPHGLYMIIRQDKNKLMEFVVEENQKFKIKTSAEETVQNTSFSKSPQNTILFEYLAFSERKFKKLNSLKKRIDNPKATDSLLIYKEMMKEINKEVIQFKKDFMQNHPDHITSLILELANESQITEKMPDSVYNNPKQKYAWYKDHYWDGIDFSDERMLRTPVFHNKLSGFFEQVVLPVPDSIISEADKILEKTASNTDLFNYIIWYLIENFDGTEIMGQDKVFVHVAEKYFQNDERVDASDNIKNNIIERAKKLKPLLIGKRPPNLIMMDTTGNFQSFYSIKSEYMLILFWDHDCGVCKKEIRHLKAFTDSTKIDIEIFAICTDTSLKKWKNYIIENQLNWQHVNGTRSVTADYHDLYDIYSTPVIYLLNKEKEIIAKRIAAEQIPDFLKNYDAMLREE